MANCYPQGRRQGRRRRPLPAHRSPRAARPPSSPGSWAIRRTARTAINVKTAAGTFEGLIDITERKVLAWQPASGQAMILLEEFFGAMDLVVADPRMAEGLKARGLTPDQAFCLPLDRRRLPEPPTRPGWRLSEGPADAQTKSVELLRKPIEALFAVVDLERRRRPRRHRHRRRPGPRGRLGLHASRTRRPPRHAPRPAAHPAMLAQLERQLPHRRQPDRVGHLELPLALVLSRPPGRRSGRGEAGGEAGRRARRSRRSSRPPPPSSPQRFIGIRRSCSGPAPPASPPPSPLGSPPARTRFTGDAALGESLPHHPPPSRSALASLAE